MTVNLTSNALYKIVQIALLVIILILLVLSKPWDTSASTEIRKITVTGQATVKEKPDEYRFNPYYEATGTNQAELKEQLTTQANQAVDALKELGVPEQDIKLDANSYDRWYVAQEGEEGTLSVYLQITTRNEELAQEIQDYLLSTPAKGQLSPRATFSEAKQKELDVQVTDQAIEDAKTKANQQAKKFGTKVGDVIEVSQSQDSVFPVAYDTLELGAPEARSSLPVLPGQNEYRQTVTVTYELQ
jgi:uncharacterized protein YggE